jgi:hypothetical protein
VGALRCEHGRWYQPVLNYRRGAFFSTGLGVKAAELFSGNPPYPTSIPQRYRGRGIEVRDNTIIEER